MVISWSRREKRGSEKWAKEFFCDAGAGTESLETEKRASPVSLVCLAVAKQSDFGQPRNQSKRDGCRLRGIRSEVQAYLAPCSLISGKVSCLSEVHSFDF